MSFNFYEVKFECNNGINFPLVYVEIYVNKAKKRRK